MASTSPNQNQSTHSPGTAMSNTNTSNADNSNSFVNSPNYDTVIPTQSTTSSNRQNSQSVNSVQSSDINQHTGNMIGSYGQSPIRMPTMGSPNLPQLGPGGNMGMQGNMGPGSMMNNMLPGGMSVGPEMLQNMMMQQQMARMSESRQYPSGMPSSSSVPSSGGY